MDASTDRISEFPQPLLHHILCFLPQEEAVRTCVLSKSWRYLGSTRPKLEFLNNKFLWKQTNLFLSILGKTLHMYRDQELCVQEYRVEFPFGIDPETVVFLKEWFPFIVPTMRGVKTFDLSFGGSTYIDLPSELFENSKSLLNLRLGGCRVSQNLPMDYKVHYNLNHLQTLTLDDVHIVDETFQNIMSSCHYIQHLVLNGCKGLTTIRLMSNNYLKSFDLFDSDEHRLKEDLCLVDVPNLESMNIRWCRTWFKFDRHCKMYFPALKSLKLWSLRLNSLPSLDILSHDFPCLQHFYIENCTGFGELRVSNSSIKKLVISLLDSSTKVAVDTPNIEVLDYRSPIPMDFSLAKISNECTSYVEPVEEDVLSEDGFQGLSKLLKAVSQTKITLELPYLGYLGNIYFDDDYHDNSGGGHDDKPALVDYVHLCYNDHGYFYSEAFLNRMFRYCRPRNILEEECTHSSEFLCEILILKRQKEGSLYNWQRDLEEASMQVRDQNSKEWISVKGTTFFASSDCCSNYKGEVWFNLKWRE